MKPQTKIPKKILQKLKNEYLALARGDIIQIPIERKIRIKIPVKICWEEDEYACINDNSIDHAINKLIPSWRDVDEIMHTQCNKHLKIWNNKIKTFIAKTNKISLKYKEDSHLLWDWFYTEEYKAGILNHV